MSFMEHPQPDACRALMPTPEPHPPGPPSRPMVCHMPKGHEGLHAITRRPRTLDRRWEGDARSAVTARPAAQELTEAEQRFLDRPDAPESLRERVAVAMVGVPTSTHWLSRRLHGDKGGIYSVDLASARRLADAALAVVRGEQ